ncbi:hypothetical protein PAXRUDRAFT_20090 [Paxillus rubicundulus Ve08.2h10]|uniref:Uncharacterized protein n=1 Tax=Paxillus rubicundulus Ve08.2h10 TaxID=930991 RepID=A0A0D0CT83_9AGAM|nr:hypothetical protein PAXRUDRAFT_20090 [Paxillus rubicundulus Ve08.2h10]
MSPRHTCAKNASQHPGQIILNAQVKRHTVAEEQADDQCLAEVQAYQQIAVIEDQIEATQKNAAKGSTVPAVGG